jgi:hypothetical protein
VDVCGIEVGEAGGGGGGGGGYITDSAQSLRRANRTPEERWPTVMELSSYVAVASQLTGDQVIPNTYPFRPLNVVTPY